MTNCVFVVLWVGMNNFEAHELVLSREVDAKVLRIIIKFKHLDENSAKMPWF